MSETYGYPAYLETGEIARIDKLVERPKENIDTTWDILNYCAETYGSEPSLGWRDVEAIIEEEKEVTKTVGGKSVTETKKWKYFQLSDFKYLSFIEVQQAVAEVGKGLLALGVRKEDVFNVYAQTSLEWQLMTHGCAAISTPVATAYDSLGEEGLAYSLSEPECVGIFSNPELLPVVAKVLPRVPSVRIVVYDGAPPQSIIEKLVGTRPDVTVLSISELRATGRASVSDADLRARHPSREDTALIMYTSGSTGAPKGVVITHANLAATVASIDRILGLHVRHGTDTYLAYLPLAHILEFVVELATLFNGLIIGYGRAKTLLDSSVRNCRGDLAAFRPTTLVGVPQIWEMIRKGIESKLSAAGPVARAAFNTTLALKRAGVPVLSHIAEYVVLSQVKAATGGKLRFGISGGASISRETQEFLSLSVAPILQGYGLTETCGMCAMLPPEKFRYGVAGVPVPAVEVRLLDVPDAGYLNTNRPPQGEICVRGAAVTTGYYKRPDLNSDESIFTRDGWFRTGDIGQWNADGTLAVIDRIKNLVKLQGGEYVALERLESAYKACTFVSNLCVHASASVKQPIAVIIPHEANLRAALGNTAAGAPLSALCGLPAARDLVLKECNAVGRRAGFKGIELLGAVILTADEWTPESGLVTAAQKLQRKKIEQRYEAEIKVLYQGQ